MKKKILYIGNNLERNNPTTIIQLSNLLEELDFEVFIYSNKKNKLLRLFHMCYGILKYKNSDYLLIDTYSTSNYYYALICSQMARLFSLKYIPILHGGNLPFRLNNNPYFSKLIFKNSYINVSPSKYLESIFIKHNYKTISIHNAINIESYKFKERNSIAPKLFWVRAFDKIYNPNMALKVLVLLQKKYSNATLCMVGPKKDNSLNEFLELAEKNNVLNVIEITGFLPKNEWLKKAKEYDIFLNTTNIDNTPVSVVEAMALGLPVVSTNVGGIPFLITNEQDGLLVSKNDSSKMAECCSTLIENNVLANRIIKKARLKTADFSNEKVKEQWLNLLNG